MSGVSHVPVLVKEVLAYLAPQPGDRLLDATVGHGGHAKAFLEAAAGGTVVGFDADSAALAEAKKTLQEFGQRVVLINENFCRMEDSVQAHSLQERGDGGGIVHNGGETRTFKYIPQQSVPRSSARSEGGFTHILFDLGLGSHQLADASRGFSFESGQSLSMRYGGGALPPAKLEGLNVLTERLGHYPDAAELIAGLSAEELAEVISRLGEERYARRVAVALKEAPQLTTGTQLAERVAAALPTRYERGRIHPATRTFQALRLAVNRELEVLEVALPAALRLLAAHGKMAVISFHSLEDRIVKQFFRSAARACICPPEQPVCTCERAAQLKLLTKHPVRAGAAEIARNPRARSAKLRVAQKTGI